IVDPVITVLPEPGQPNSELVARLRSHRSFRVDRSIGSVADPGVVAALAGLYRVELDDARRGVASEQCPLRPAQDLDAINVKGRKALEDRVFEDHVVIDEAHRLRGVEVEIG